LFRWDLLEDGNDITVGRKLGMDGGILPAAAMPIATVNPATGETLKTFQELSDSQIEQKLALGARTFLEYRRVPFEERAALMNRAAEILDQDQQRLGELITIEMGKPINASIAEINKCALVCRYYAEHAQAFLADEPVKTNASRSFVRYQPLGVILAIMPWNFPFWQVFRFAAPALMAGDVALLKHASNVPQCALAIEEVFQRAGFPEGVFQTLLIGVEKVQRILDDPRVVAATLTGSETAGRSVASGAADEVKKVVLELGGSDPFIVMPSADLAEAVKIAVKARTVNSGQSCIAAKRFIVHEKIARDFERQFAAAMDRLKVGDPMGEATEIGPLATPQIVSDVERQVRESVKKGARVLTGGKRLGGAGNYYAPTVLAEVPLDAPAAAEEVFGPVAAVFRVKNIDEAIGLANNTPFGLGSSAWTNDPAEREQFINEIEAGLVFINAMVASDPRLPFGGVKRSGFGRELGLHGIREFVNIKTVWINEPATRTEAAQSE
jgi:succinate-semialdehyde dehydrogenase/glutarate-semialdehyde dehydrogenase